MYSAKGRVRAWLSTLPGLSKNITLYDEVHNGKRVFRWELQTERLNCVYSAWR